MFRGLEPLPTRKSEKQFKTQEAMGSGASKKSSKPPAEQKASVTSPSQLISQKETGSMNSSQTSVQSPASLSCSESEKRAADNTTTPLEQEKTAASKSENEAKQAVGAKKHGFLKRKQSDWEKANIDQLMSALEIKDLEKHWYDVVDDLISREEAVVVPDTKRKGWRTVRLFISSTFKDMHSEREHLVKKIIPALRQWCEKRKLRLIECDLRWGVPKDADTRETILTCLSEIDRCRVENQYAYILSLLSERYGYVMNPEEVPSDIKARYKWIPGMSITSLEIMTGAYWDKNPNALFMMRKPNYLQRVDEDVKKAYVEVEQESIHSLSVLKDKIKTHFTSNVKDYDCTVEGRNEKYMVLGGLENFGKIILDHFMARIAEQYPEIPAEQEMTETEIKRAEQEEFMLQRSEVLLGRNSEIMMVDEYINTNPASIGLLTLVGYPGTGKSSLMAYSAKRYIQNKALKVFFHFVGVTPDSTSAFSVLSRMYRECMPAERQDTMPLDPDDMMRFTSTMLQEAADHAKSEGFAKLVIFIDALNQLDDRGNAQKLTWLPRQLPDGVRVIVSTLEGVCLDSLRNNANPPKEVEVNPLNVEIRKCIVEELLQPYNKRLDTEQMDILVKKTDSGRPLYLSTACEELRVFGDFRRLTDAVCVLPGDLLGLTEVVLQRVVREFGGDLVQATLCLIETSHFGLEEMELLHLLSAQPSLPMSPSDCSPRDFADKLPMAKWGFLYVGLRSFLRPNSSAGEGRIDFYHRTVSKVVRHMYLSDPQEAAKWHGRLIQFFLECPSVARKAEELPFHYSAMNDLEGLRQCLLKRDIFVYLYTEQNKQTLMQFWSVVGGYQLAAESYKNALKDMLSLHQLEGTEEGEKLSTKVAWFMVDIGEYDKANEMLTDIISKLTAKYGDDSVHLCDPLHATMTLLMRKALKYVYSSHPGYRECCTKGKRLVPQTMKLHRKKFAANSNELGNILSLCGYFDWSLLEESKQIFEANKNKVGLAVVLYTLGEKNQYNRNEEVPVAMFKESLALCKAYFGMYHLHTARCVQVYGQMYWNKYTQSGRLEQLAESLIYYTMELEILEEVLGHNHPTTVRSREDVIIILQSLGRDGDAAKYLAVQPESREGIA